MSKIIAVFGATGSQGGSVLRSLVKNGNYHIKAITRNPNSDKAKELASLNNVSVHQADLDDSASLDKVLEGVHGSFVVTDFTGHAESKETKQGVALIDSAIKNKVSHVVFSGLENVASVINKPCLHFDNKAAVEDYGLTKKDQINFTSIRLPAYYQVLVNSLLFKAQPNQFILTLPMSDKPIYCMNVHDAGDCVTSIFNNENEYKSKIVSVAGDQLKATEIASVLNKHLSPIQFMYGNFTLEKFLSFGFPGVEDITNMFEYYQTEKMFRDLDLTKKLNPNVLSFDQFVAQNIQQINEGLAKK